MGISTAGTSLLMVGPFVERHTCVWLTSNLQPKLRNQSINRFKKFNHDTFLKKNDALFDCPFEATSCVPTLIVENKLNAGGEGDNRGGCRSSPERGIFTGAEPVRRPEEATPLVIDSHKDGCSASYIRLLSLNCSSVSSTVEPITHSVFDELLSLENNFFKIEN